MISKTAQYALRAVALIASEPGKNHGAQELARRIGAPPNYMGKLLKQLADSKVLHSVRGNHGGFRLAREPGEIHLIDVVDPIEHVSRWRDCFLDFGACRPDQPCAIHACWKPIREGFMRLLETATIDSIPVAESEVVAGHPVDLSAQLSRREKT
ncbi:MAG TPA: Rrf2 family transcriptional regulator [Spirochaetia bacterium]|nr:Rrf2 family transcriptional regulator [Spirochaetia bacterium]